MVRKKASKRMVDTEQTGFCSVNACIIFVRLSSVYDRILLVGSDIADSTSNDLILAITSWKIRKI